MTVTFQTTLDDHNAFSRAVKLSSFGVKGMILLLMFLMPTGANLLNPWFYQSLKVLGWETMLKIYGRGLLVPALILTAFLILRFFWEKIRVQKSALLSTPTTIIASDESIEQINKENRNTLVWPLVLRVIETDAHFFVLNAPQTGLIIPKRAFDSPTQSTEFGAFLKQKWAQHHPNIAPIASPR